MMAFYLIITYLILMVHGTSVLDPDGVMLLTYRILMVALT